MSIVDKKAILESLSAADDFDAAASPFIAMRLENGSLYRSSSIGFISTQGMMVDDDCVFVSLAHFYDCMKAMPEDKVELALEPGSKVPSLLVKSIESNYNSELRVRTVPKEESCLKSHDLGIVCEVIDPKLFKGFNAKAFKIAAPPFMIAGKILISTQHGIAMWQGPAALQSIKLHPRDSFLKFLNPGVRDIFLTDKGFWGASTGSLVMFQSSHNLSANLHQTYNVPGEKVAEFPAYRLTQVLAAAADLCDSSKNVRFDPAKGIVSHNQYGNPQEFGLGPQKGWTGFSVFWQSAKLIHDALSQADDETAVLYRVDVHSYPTMRLTRGPWEVNFKVF